MCRHSRGRIFRFNGKTHWEMFLLFYGRHVGAPRKGNNMAFPYKALFQITREWKTAQSEILARCFMYDSSLTSKIPGLIHSCLLGIREIATTQTNVVAAKDAGVSCQTQVCLVNSYQIETVREYFVLTRCQKRLCGVMAYQLSTPCSADSVAQFLQRFTFIVFRGYFQQLKHQMTWGRQGPVWQRIWVSSEGANGESHIRFILKQLNYSLSISMRDSWLGHRPRQLSRDRNLELII